MNKMILAAALCLAGSAFAQERCEVEMRDNYSSRRIAVFPAVDYNDGCKEGMRRCRLEIQRRGLQNSADCIRIGSRPTPSPVPPRPIPPTRPVPPTRPIPPTNPYPPTDPYPYPPTNPYPPTYNDVIVTGFMENKYFEFRGRDAADLYISCLTDIRSVRPTNVDDLFFTVNGDRYKSTTTGGWYSDTDICSLLEQEARRSINIVTIRSARIVGSLETTPFRFEAYDRSSLLTSCTTEIEALRLSQTDDLQYSLNGATFQRLSTGGWWRTPAEVCKAMLVHMDPML